MKHLYIVGYELHKEPPEDNNDITAIIKTYDYLKIGNSEYCIYTDQGPDSIVNMLEPYFRKGDKLLVIKITNKKQGLLTDTQWKWINERFS